MSILTIFWNETWINFPQKSTLYWQSSYLINSKQLAKIYLKFENNLPISGFISVRPTSSLSSLGITQSSLGSRVSIWKWIVEPPFFFFCCAHFCDVWMLRKVHVQVRHRRHWRYVERRQFKNVSRRFTNTKTLTQRHRSCRIGRLNATRSFQKFASNKIFPNLDDDDVNIWASLCVDSVTSKGDAASCQRRGHHEEEQPDLWRRCVKTGWRAARLPTEVQSSLLCWKREKIRLIIMWHN